MVELTYPMKLALRGVADASTDLWVDVDYHRLHRGSLRALRRRGLVEFEKWAVRLTDAGRSAAAELKGAS